MFKPGPQPSLQELTGGRNEKEKTDKVSEEAGGKEENATRQDEPSL